MILWGRMSCQAQYRDRSRSSISKSASGGTRSPKKSRRMVAKSGYLQGSAGEAAGTIRAVTVSRSFCSTVLSAQDGWRVVVEGVDDEEAIKVLAGLKDFGEEITA